MHIFIIKFLFWELTFPNDYICMHICMYVYVYNKIIKTPTLLSMLT